MNNATMLHAALEYAQKGWAVFPLWGVHEDLSCACGLTACADAGKHPRVKKGVKEASRDPVVIRGWFDAEAPVSNVAIATGEISGLTVLDIDIGPGKLGAETWLELNREAGEPQTLTATTGSGGAHVFFSYASSLNTSSNTLGPGVDCRNDGGYVVAAPSRHRSGGSYEWVDVETSLLPLPKHLSTKREKRGRPRKDDPTRRKYSIEDVKSMLGHIEADDRDTWRNVGVILGREFSRSEAAWEAYVEWSDKWSGKKGPKHDQIMRESFHKLSQDSGDLSIGTIIRKAIDGGWSPQTGQIKPEQFLYYAPGNNFIYRSTNAFWPAESVDACCSMVNDNGALMKPSVWLKRKRAITSMTSDPLIVDEVALGFDCTNGALTDAEGGALYNAYRPARVKLGDAKLARPFVDHVRALYNKPGDADQFLDYMAHRVQKPGEKPRFALLIAGEQGVGKDTAISMCHEAIGVWNIANVEPAVFEHAFNEHVGKVLVVVSEAANTNEISKWVLNERMKLLIAGNPDYQEINPKYGQKFHVRMHCGVVITTNHMLTGVYIPQEDRRYDVLSCATKSEMGIIDDETRAYYFAELWRWFYEENGPQHVAAFLHERDISRFSAPNGQRKTVAHKMVVASGMHGDDWLQDALELLPESKVVRTDELWAACERASEGDVQKKDFNARLHHAMDRAGYAKLMAPTSGGRWRATASDGSSKKVALFYEKDSITEKQASEMARAVLERREGF